MRIMKTFFILHHGPLSKRLNQDCNSVRFILLRIIIFMVSKGENNAVKYLVGRS